MSLRRLRAAAQRRPRLVDGAFAALLAGLSIPLAAQTGGTSGFGWFWFAAIHVPLVWRRRVPVIVFWTVAGLVPVAPEVGALGPSLIFVPLVAVYAVARYRPRRALWPTAAVPCLYAAFWVSNDGPWWDMVALAAMFAAAALLGTNVQTRRAYLAALEERAHRLEREREQRAQLAVAAERARIAREVHDIVAHNLAVMVALADGAVATTPVAPQRAVDMMATTAATGREALTEIRRLVGLLRAGETDRPPGISSENPVPQPGFADIDGLVEQVRGAGLRVTMTREGTPGTWGAGAGLTVYRIVQEALTNTMKHAGPQANAEVRLHYDAAGVEVEVVDDGGRRLARPANGQPATGHGLVGMTERVAPYGGRMHAGPRPGSGWRVHAHLPFGGNEVT